MTGCVSKTTWWPLSASNDFDNVTNIANKKLDATQTILVGKETFSDFILEFEFKSDPQVNLGVQIRQANQLDQGNSLRGYHIDIDPINKKEVGVISWQGETRFLPLYPSAVRSKSSVINKGDWNHIRIEAIGSSIRVWNNRKMVANLVDDRAVSGLISIHSQGLSTELTKTWRNIRIQTEGLIDSMWPVDKSVREISYLKNKLTDHEKQLGYRLLWDGKTFNGWRDVRTGTISALDWKIDNGQLQVVAQKNPDHQGPPGGLITEQLFGNFELELAFKISKGQNSGIKYFVDPELVKERGLGMGIEYQLLDDGGSKYATMGTNGNRTLASVIDLITPKPLTNPSAKVASFFHGVGTWNKARIVSKNGIVEHWLNNEKVAQYDRYSQLFEALVQRSMHSKWPNYGRFERGHILLQDFDGNVSFHSIKIREL